MDSPNQAEREAFMKHTAAANKKFSESYLARDVESIKELFTDDVRFMPPNAPMMNGTGGMKDFMDTIVARGHHSISMTSQEVFGPVNDMAAERLVVAFDTKEGKRKWDIKALHLYKKVDGKWKIYADCWNFDHPEPKA